ncbi:hypothetical protein [Anabaena sp. CA = ATCC 33047]|nr:hypothetical protein [Anabaena sp. CA = ATCC 33047]
MPHIYSCHVTPNQARQMMNVANFWQLSQDIYHILWYVALAAS